jgi:protein gp37
MGKSTDISWCHHTFNPWWGCQRVSPGCEHCYAESKAKWLAPGIWGPPKTSTRRTFGDRHWREPLTWNATAIAAGERRLVFCASMADVFEDNVTVESSRLRLWDVIRATPMLDWLLLTKRPQNVWDMLPSSYWSNVWLGTSTETQEYADLRMPQLARMRDRVPVLFVSVEPQLERLSLLPWLRGGFVDWVIVGGESGPRHRPFDVDWARALRDECAATGVAFHYKQFGGRTHAEGGCELDGREYKEFPRAA